MDENQNLYFGSIEALQEFFRDGRPYFNERYVKKLAQLSIYWNRVNTQSWPLNSTTEQVGFRFGRGWYNENQPWRKINPECGGDSCENNFETVKMPGTDSYTWDLLRREMITEWFCVENLLYKLFPAAQVLQIEDTNIRISQHVHEEFIRANYLGAADYHWLAFTNEDGEWCGQAEQNGWYVEQHTGTNESGFNLQYIRVNCDPSDLYKVAFPSLDVFDDILQILQNEDDAYRLDIREATGAPMLDILVPDAKVARKLYFQARESNGYWDSTAGFDRSLSELSLGIRRTIGDYALSYDIDAPRFNVDSTFNANLPAFNTNDPSTWPRLIRVPRYILASAEQGCKYIPNPDFQNADFAITVPWVEKAITKWMMPSATGYGNVQMPAQDYSGAWEFFNPKTESNPWQKFGRFQAQHRIGAQIVDPTLMHPILHRLDKSRKAITSDCPLNEYYAPSAAPDCYVCEGVSEEA